MPRLFHRPPKYGHHKSTNQAIVCWGGRLIYLGPYGSQKSHDRYRAFIEEWRTKLRHEAQKSVDAKRAKRRKEADDARERLASAVTPETLRQKWRQGLKVSVDELIYVYRQHANDYYVKDGKPTREAELVVEVTGHLGKKHGRDRADDFGPVDLDAFREGLIDELDWSRLHLNKQTARIVRMFKWGAQKEICSPLVHQQLASLGGLKKGRTRARETAGVSCVADEVIDKTLPKLPPIVADMVRVQRYTGARPGEVCQMRPRDLDRSAEVWLYRPDSHKTEHHDKQRVIPIGPKAQEVLAKYLDRPEGKYCFSPAESEKRRRDPGKDAAEFVSKRLKAPRWRPGDCYDTSSYRIAIRRVCKKLKLPIWTPNQLRHTAATAIRKRFGLEAAQVVCGHAQADVTQVYAERDLQLALSVAAEVG